MNSNLLIVPNGKSYLAFNEIDRAVLHQASSASAVLTWALNQVGAQGGTIRLASGVYLLDAPVELKDNVRLVGDGRATRVGVSALNEVGVCLSLKKVKGVVVQEMLLTGKGAKHARQAIVLDGAGDCKVRQMWITSFAEYGVYLKNSCYLCQVSDSTICGNGVSNVYLHKCVEGEYGDYVPNTLSHLTIYGGGKGVELNNAVVVNIVACSCYHTTGMGFHIHDWSNSITLTGCRTFQILGNALVAQKANELNLSGNIFCWHTEDGLVLKDCRWGTITGNEIIDSGSYNAGGQNLKTKMDSVEVPELYSGMILEDTRGFHLGGNAVFNWDVAPRMKHGIVERPCSKKNVIVHNNINFYTEAPLVCEGEESIVKDNICEPEIYLKANQDKIIQTFRTELTQKLIDEMA